MKKLKHGFAAMLIFTATIFFGDGTASAHPPDESDHIWQYDPEVSFYGPGLYGNRTACGITLTPSTHGVAHRSLPCGTLIRFEWADHDSSRRGDGISRETVARVIDRGPYVRGRTWDLTAATCHEIKHCYTAPIRWTR